MAVPSFSSTASTYAANFNDNFAPKTLGQAGLLSDEGKALMGSIAAANLATEAAAMKGGFDLEKQSIYNDTLLAIQELKNEQAKKKAIIDQLSTPMAGASLTKFLAGGPGNRLKNSVDNVFVDSVLQNSLTMPSSGDDSSSGSTTVGTTDMDDLITQEFETIKNSSLSEGDKNKQYQKLLKLKKSYENYGK